MSQTCEDEKWKTLRYSVCSGFVVKLFAALESAGIVALLIKGHAASQYYPTPSDRIYSDIDIAVSGKDYERALEFRRTAELGFGLDVHCGLRHLHPSRFDDLLSRAGFLDIDGRKVPVPSDEDNLIILATHWLNDGGANRARLQDLKNLVESRPQLDWMLIQQILPSHRLRWLDVAISCAIEFGDLERKTVPFSDERLRIPQWLVRALEAEWKSPELKPLYYEIEGIGGFVTQLRKRFPPNPIVAVVENDGDFDSSFIPWSQAKSFLRRVPTALKMQYAMRRGAGTDKQ